MEAAPRGRLAARIEPTKLPAVPVFRWPSLPPSAPREREAERRRLSGLALLLFHEGLGAPLQFLRREVFLVGGDKPAVDGRILHRATAVAVEHVGRLHDR